MHGIGFSISSHPKPPPPNNNKKAWQINVVKCYNIQNLNAVSFTFLVCRNVTWIIELFTFRLVNRLETLYTNHYQLCFNHIKYLYIIFQYVVNIFSSNLLFIGITDHDEDLFIWYNYCVNMNIPSSVYWMFWVGFIGLYVCKCTCI